MIGWTLCSGIGAPELAAPWVDWRLASEIEPFPRAVLQQRFRYREPEGQNQGEPLLWSDMTGVTPELAAHRGVPLPDVLVAGTPCQSFSVAGLRRGTNDERGNLTLKFVETCHAIVDARPDGTLTVVWENVPGVLSDSGNAFGGFLGGIVGADGPIIPCPRPPRGQTTDHWQWVKRRRWRCGGRRKYRKPHHRPKWPRVGMVAGPLARAAWGVFNAEYFGVAQRRRRVFVVISFGNGADPAAVLFERKGMQGNTAPRREAGEGVAADVAPSLRARSNDPHRTDMMAYVPSIAIQERAVSENIEAGPQGAGFSTEDVAYTLEARHHVQAVAQSVSGNITHTLSAEGADASEDGTGRGTPIVAFDTTQITSKSNYSNPQLGDPCHPLAAGAHPSAIADLAVRRLTPTECARLQGMPDNHTRIEWRGKPAEDCPDGLQYKSYGNSMAVPCVKWIMDRIKISLAVQA